MEEHFKYKFEELFNPLLTALHNLGGSATGDDIESEVIQILNLNDDEINEIHRETTTKLTYRQAWAKNYLKRFGLLENSSRGVWSLTEEGLKTNYVDAEEVKRKVKDVKENERIKKEQSATILENRNVQDESKEVETIISQEEESHYNINQYKFSEDKDKPFISESDFLQAVSLLRRKKKYYTPRSSWSREDFYSKKDCLSGNERNQRHQHRNNSVSSVIQLRRLYSRIKTKFKRWI